MARVDRSAAARLKALRAFPDPDALLTALSDPSHLVVEEAAKRITQPRAAGALLDAYLRLHRSAPEGDPGCWARMALLEALGRLEAPEGEQPACLAVRTVQVEAVGFGMADTATGLRVAGAGLLANLGVPGALLDLAWLLHDTAPNAACSERERLFAKLACRVAAARAIGQLGDPAGAAILAVKLAFPGDEHPDVLAECMDGLVALREPRTLELLTPWLQNGSEFLAAAAATALAAAGGEKALPILLGALTTCRPGLKETLVFALGSIRSDQTQAALRELARHMDPVIREAACSLL